VPPLCPTRFCLDASSVAGSAFPLTIAAIDAAGLVDAGYTRTVVFSSSDSSAILPPPFSFAPEDAGVAVINGFVLTQFGTQTITATDAGDPAISGTLRISVAAALASLPTTSDAARVTMAGAIAILGLWLSWRRSPGD
jgi:ATP-dependent phosphoenolpyruvate carboxykinase